MVPLMRVRGHPWTAPPARAIRYFVWQRIADWYNGRRDGRLGLPVVPGSMLETRPTGVLEEPTEGVGALRLGELRHHYRGAMEGELTRFLRFRDELSQRVEEADQRLETASSRLADLLVQREAVRRPPSADALTRRRLAEADHDAELVRRRRLSDHRRRVQEIEERCAAAEAELGRARQAVETYARMTRCRWDLTRIRARRLHEHAHRRANVYWRQLVRHHPRGDALNGLLATAGPDLPAWVSAENPPSAPSSGADHMNPHDADPPTRSHRLSEQENDRDRTVASPTATSNRGA
jgi:ABC transport system ATP-binding/permease protein